MNIAPMSSQPQQKISSPADCQTSRSSNSSIEPSLHYWYRTLALWALILAFIVVGLGAYTRLVHAGLGCPDWPGCYGHLTWPTTTEEITSAQALFPEAPVEINKTWPEMIHRYFAGTLGLLILTITAISVLIKVNNNKSQSPIKLPFIILVVVIVQAAFGMWTVTLKLWPQVVTLHLLGGFTTLALIALLNLRVNQYRLFRNLSNYSIEKLPTITIINKLKNLTALCFLLIFVQISLGGWTAANYAALPCTDFPTCQGSFWPSMDFKSGFNITQTIGPNYLGGQLDGASRTAIQVTHRIGAVCVTIFSLLLIVAFYRSKFFYNCAALLAIALTTQIALGISNVILVTPLVIAVLHNLFGAILLLTIVYCWFNLTEYTKQRSTEINL